MIESNATRSYEEKMNHNANLLIPKFTPKAAVEHQIMNFFFVDGATTTNDKNKKNEKNQDETKNKEKKYPSHKSYVDCSIEKNDSLNIFHLNSYCKHDLATKKDVNKKECFQKASWKPDEITEEKKFDIDFKDAKSNEINGNIKSYIIKKYRVQDFRPKQNFILKSEFHSFNPFEEYSDESDEKINLIKSNTLSMEESIKKLLPPFCNIINNKIGVEANKPKLISYYVEESEKKADDGQLLQSEENYDFSRKNYHSVEIDNEIKEKNEIDLISLEYSKRYATTIELILKEYYFLLLKVVILEEEMSRSMFNEGLSITDTFVWEEYVRSEKKLSQYDADDVIMFSSHKQEERRISRAYYESYSTKSFYRLLSIGHSLRSERLRWKKSKHLRSSDASDIFIDVSDYEDDNIGRRLKGNILSAVPLLLPVYKRYLGYNDFYYKNYFLLPKSDYSYNELIKVSFGNDRKEISTISTRIYDSTDNLSYRNNSNVIIPGEDIQYIAIFNFAQYMDVVLPFLLFQNLQFVQQKLVENDLT